MAIQSESAHDKQILTFGRRDRVVKAAIDFTRACQTGRLAWRSEAETALFDAVKAYRPKLFDGSQLGKKGEQP